MKIARTECAAWYHITAQKVKRELFPLHSSEIEMEDLKLSACTARTRDRFRILHHILEGNDVRQWSSMGLLTIGERVEIVRIFFSCLIDAFANALDLDTMPNSSQMIVRFVIEDVESAKS